MADDNNDILTRYSQFLDASGEHLSYAALSTYRNSAGELSQKERMFFTRHLDSCRECTSRLKEADEVEREETTGGEKAIARFSPAVFRYAAAAVLIIAAGISILFVSRDASPGKSLMQDLPSDRPMAEAVGAPERFIPDQMLENFVERKVRSASGLTLIAPGTGDTVPHPVVFAWKGGKAGMEYTVTVVSNKGVEVWKERTASAGLTLHKKLEPGLYYAKLEINGNLVLVGKFVVLQ